MATKIYNYGGVRLDPDSETLAQEQIKLAHRYRNNLVEIELDRRARTDETLRSFSPELAEVEGALASVEEQLAAGRDKIREARQEQGTRHVVLDATDAKILKQKRSDLFARRKELRRNMFRSEGPVKAALEKIAADIVLRQKALRAENSESLHWGTRGALEMAARTHQKAAPPKFHRFDGTGKLAVQFQRQANKPDFDARALHSCAGNLARLEEPDPEQTKQSRRAGRRVSFCFCVGRDEKRAPIFLRGTVRLHRPLPEGCPIKWAYLVRRRVGLHFRWMLQFVIENAPAKPTAETGTVGVDIGWRIRSDNMDSLIARLRDGDEPLTGAKRSRALVELGRLAGREPLRVAYLFDDSGHERELLLPGDWRQQMRRVEGIRSERDRLLNVLKDQLSSVSWPGTLQERAAHMSKWRSAARFASFILAWRDARFVGDAEIFDIAEAWRLRDKHLLCFEAHLRDQLLARRTDLYRNWAAQIATQYHTVVFEDFDLRAFSRDAVPEDLAREMPESAKVQDGKENRREMRDACLSDFRRFVEERAAESLRIPAHNTTRECAACGHVTQHTNPAKLVLRCEGCGRERDQDSTAAENLLSRHLGASVGVVA